MATLDTLIIGGGLTGLFLTHQLHAQGQKVALIEGRERLGGRFGRPSEAQPYSSPGLDFIPATPENLSVLEWLRNHSPVPLQVNVREHQAQVFDEARWKPLAGFGDAGFASIEELSFFTNPNEAVLTPGLEQVVRALVEQLPIVAQTLAAATNLKVEDGRVTEVTVNGDKNLQAERVIFTAAPALLNQLMIDDHLAPKHRTRLAKMKTWSAVALHLQHTTALEAATGVRVFATSSKEFEPVIGRIFGLESRWLMPVPAARELEHEFVAQCIRNIKRQIKRAWPEAFDGQVEEKIFLQSRAFGLNPLKTKDPFCFPEIENLYVANHEISELPGDLSSLDITERLLQTLNQLPTLEASC